LEYKTKTRLLHKFSDLEKLVFFQMEKKEVSDFGLDNFKVILAHNSSSLSTLYEYNQDPNSLDHNISLTNFKISDFSLCVLLFDSEQGIYKLTPYNNKTSL
jgi:hypothetical protein